MQVHDNTDTVSQIEELIMECKPFIERLARKFVALGPSLLDFDDYVQVAMIRVWEKAEIILAIELPVRYVVKVAENAMMAEFNKLHEIPALSLDAPLRRDSSFSLADTLAEKNVPVSRSSSKRVAAVRKAVERLDFIQRHSIRYVHGFEGAGLHTGAQFARVRGVSRVSVNNSVQFAYKNLRSDKLLCKVVGVEA